MCYKSKISIFTEVCFLIVWPGCVYSAEIKSEFSLFFVLGGLKVKGINNFAKIIILSVVVMITPSAMATLISETETFTGDDTLTFNEFDSILGTLTSIEIIFDLSIDNGWLIVDNDDSVQADVTIVLGAVAAISSTDVRLTNASWQPVVDILVASTTAVVTLAAEIGDGPGIVDANGPDGTTLNGEPDSDLDNGLIRGAYFVDYIGTGTFEIDVDVTDIAEWGSPPNVEDLSSAVDILSAGSSVTVNYTYTPIPEPATMALLGLGSIALIRKRRL